MLLNTVLAVNLITGDVKSAEANVAFVRQSYCDLGFVTHVVARDVVCGQLFREYTITAIKEDEDPNSIEYK